MCESFGKVDLFSDNLDGKQSRQSVPCPRSPIAFRPSNHKRLLLDLDPYGGDSFLTGDMFECDLAHRRSVAVLCKL